jgi:hypothetical protein
LDCKDMNIFLFYKNRFLAGGLFLEFYAAPVVD